METLRNMKKKIAIVAGGYSSEFAVSLRSAQGVHSFLDPERYEMYIVLITKEKWIVSLPEGEEKNREIPIDKNDFSFTQNEQKIRFDFAYITIHGTPGENGLLQGYFDMLKIPYSSCGVLASALTFNKYYCNQFLKNFGVKIAESVFLHKNDLWDSATVLSKLGLPVFVKPNDSGSSCGVTKVTSAEQLQTAVEKAFEEGTEALVERFMPGTEVTCGCYKIKDKATVFPVTEVVSKNEFFDFDAKYTPNGAEEITPARISRQLTEEIQTLTSKIYDWIGAKGIIRIDYIISSENEIRMLEVNTTPGLTATSFIPQQFKAAGLNIRDIFTEIIENELDNI
jgi:D-alanine-D-alanine ligase